MRGWFSQGNPFSWDLDAFEFAPDIRRLDSGTPSTVPAVASLPAMKWRMGQNTAALAAHNRKLTGQLQAGLDEMGLNLASPADPDQRGGSLMVVLPDHIDAANVVAGGADNHRRDRADPASAAGVLGLTLSDAGGGRQKGAVRRVRSHLISS